MPVAPDPRVLTFPSLYAVERRWSETEEDQRRLRRRLLLTDVAVAGLPPSVQTVARVFLETWAGYARESADLAAGFVMALGAADVIFHDAEGYVADRFLHLDGRLGPAR